ncbi:MAG: hypothetical protein NT129_03060 [Candidatus Aenigmarchaeota archaeon]|nr:hypothetical protein [Candidatus Aenigmarchaeota archaeon]
MKPSAFFPRKVSKTSLLAFLSFLIIFSILSSTVFAQEISLDIQGTCKEYNVTLTATGIDGCYDVKIELTSPDSITGSIFDPREGWKSSFFFIDEALCINATASKTFAMRTDSTSATINFEAKLRPVSEAEVAWESGYYIFKQKCPPVADDTMFVILVALIVVLVLLAAVTLYVKGGKARKKRK